MNDLIKREDAIEALKGREGILHDTYTVVAIIRSVPSADRGLDMKFSTARKRMLKIIDELEKQCIDYYEAGEEAGRTKDIPSADIDMSEYSDKLWKSAYERGKEEEHRWWSEHCAKCTDADRPQGKWITYYPPMSDMQKSMCGVKEKGYVPDKRFGRSKCSLCGCGRPMYEDNYCPNCGAYMKGADDE